MNKKKEISSTHEELQSNRELDFYTYGSPKEFDFIFHIFCVGILLNESVKKVVILI